MGSMLPYIAAYMDPMGYKKQTAWPLDLLRAFRGIRLRRGCRVCRSSPESDDLKMMDFTKGNCGYLTVQKREHHMGIMLSSGILIYHLVI